MKILRNKNILVFSFPNMIFMGEWICIGGTNTRLFSENNGYRIQIN